MCFLIHVADLINHGSQDAADSCGACAHLVHDLFEVEEFAHSGWVVVDTLGQVFDLEVFLKVKVLSLLWFGFLYRNRCLCFATFLGSGSGCSSFGCFPFLL